MVYWVYHVWKSGSSSYPNFGVALFRYRNACKNELTNLKIVEMKKQLPKMKNEILWYCPVQKSDITLI